MPYDSSELRKFLKLVQQSNILKSEEIDEILRRLGGIEEVLADDIPIAVYEEVGWKTGETVEQDVLLRFLSEMREEIEKFPDNRYYFAEAIVVGCRHSERDRDIHAIINSMPESYQAFLANHKSDFP